LSLRNEAKYESLKYIGEVSFATSAEIAEYREVTHGCQSTLLTRYWRYGLLNRCSGEGKEKIYTLSQRGEERLAWLEEQFENDIEDNFSKLLTTIKRCRIRRDDEFEELLKNLKRCRVIRSEEDYVEIERV
jgi:DNA-binding MarR family transcriptional regulator